jgi:pyruvate,orthophosphate dikinase
VPEPGLIHRFADPLPLDGGAARRWLGSKGASLAEMTQMGLKVPPGFTLTTKVWAHLEEHGELPEGLDERVREELARIEQTLGLRFGDPGAPLLLAVRSGGPTSMPGMLDTVLDVGVDGAIVRGLAQRHSDRFAADVRRRFVESFATVVLGVPRDAFDAVLGGRGSARLDAQELDALAVEYERLVAQEVGARIPDDPWEQLYASIRGVLGSWRSARAEKYRAAHGISEDEGTAVTLQAMVYGNLGLGSGAGVVFSRNPSSGERALIGEWLPEAQGEDVVSGRQTPRPLTSAQVRRGMEDDSLERAMPEALGELRDLTERLEQRYGDAVDVEMTIENGSLFVLQCRAAKRTARAAARIAVELVGEGVLTRAEALTRVEPTSLRQLLTPRLPDPQLLLEAGLRPIARGLAASPGAATGRIVLDTEAAERYGAGEELILVRAETSAEDVEAMRLANGVLTAAGGLTSHAAVVARAMGKPCVAGATSMHVDYVRRRVTARGSDGALVELAEGDVVTIDGGRGLVYAAEVPVEPAPASEHVELLLAWADEAREVEVWAEVTSERLARVGRSFGADGIFVSRAPEGPAALVSAAADVPLLLAVSPDGLDDALAALRPGTDGVVVDLGDLEATRARAGEIAVWVSVHPSDLADPPPADGLVAELEGPDAATDLDVGGGAPVLLRGDPDALAEAVAGLDERAGRAAVAVAPLDVPVARLWAARAAKATSRPTGQSAGWPSIRPK